MTTKQEVIDVHERNPDWTAPEIARELGCGDDHVRSTARRYGLDLPKARLLNGCGPRFKPRVAS